MKKKQVKFLKQLVETASPTGFEEDVAELIRQQLSSVVDEIQTDTMGSVHAILKGTTELAVSAHVFVIFAEIGSLRLALKNIGLDLFIGKFSGSF